MSRHRTSTVIALVIAALCIVAVQTRRLIVAERGAFIDRFSEEEERQVVEVAKALSEDLADVEDDLRFAARLVSTAEHEAEVERHLRALLASVARYRLAGVYDLAGRRTIGVEDPRAALAVPPEPVDAMMRDTALAALAGASGDATISPEAPHPQLRWFRVFAVAVPTSTRPRRALSILVDLEPFFKRTRPLAASPSARLLVLGRHGQPLPGSDSGLAAHVADPRSLAAAARWRDVIARMGHGEQGHLRLERRDVETLGIGVDEHIATFAPVVGSGHGWALGKITSLSSLREHEHGTLVKIGVGAAAIAACLVALGVYFVVSARRALLLRERLRHAEAVERLHAQTQGILDHMPSAVLALSQRREVIAVNRAMRLYGPRATPGDTLAACFPGADAADVARIASVVDQVLDHGGVRSILAERMRLFGFDGCFSIHAIALGPQLAEARVIVVVEDLTEVTSLTTQLLHAEKLATVGILAAGIAHEVGTPIGVIRGRAEYLAEKLVATGRDERDAAVIVEQADLVTRIIRQLLDFSRAKPTDIRPVSVGSVATGAIELLRIEAARRKLIVEARVPEALPTVAADRDQLQQVLVNLLMNACDATQAGGHVTLSAAVDEAPEGRADAVRIEIADEGCGIPERHLHQVFDPFFTTKKRGHGTGLGLTIAAQIVRNHRGQIELDSGPRKGTRVVVRWPTAQAGRSEVADGLIG